MCNWSERWKGDIRLKYKRTGGVYESSRRIEERMNGISEVGPRESPLFHLLLILNRSFKGICKNKLRVDLNTLFNEKD